jgi:segregation and condensation protein B
MAGKAQRESNVASDAPAAPVEVELPGADAAERLPDSGEPSSIGAERDEPCSTLPLALRIEALLVGADRPLGESRVVELLGRPVSAREMRQAIDELNGAYRASGRSFSIERLAGGWQILTRAEYGPLLGRLERTKSHGRLSQPALETLAIVAYRQPIIRAEIEAIRGVSCGEVLRGLLERRLVRIAGRAEELGRPMLYGTTKEFLSVFGLAGLDDLPEVEGARRPATHAITSAAPSGSTAASRSWSRSRRSGRHPTCSSGSSAS